MTTSLKWLCLVVLLYVGSCTVKVKHHQSGDYDEIKIIKSERTVMLNGAYPEEINKLTLNTASSEPIKYFYHVVAPEYSPKLADIRF